MQFFAIPGGGPISLEKMEKRGENKLQWHDGHFSRQII